MSDDLRHPDPEEFPPGSLAYQMEDLRLRLADLGDVLWRERWTILIGAVLVVAVVEMVAVTITLF